MKRTLLTAILVLVALSLFATGQSEQEKPKDTPVTIRFWSTAQSQTYHYKWLPETVALFNEQNIGKIIVEYTNTPNADQYLNKLTTEMAANNAPDIFVTWTAGRLEPFVQANRIEPLNDFINNSKTLTDNVNIGNCTSATFNGVIYAIPSELAGEIIFYNKAIFNEYNLQVPETWEDLKNVVQVLTNEGITPFSLGNKDPWPGTIPYMSIFDRVNGPDAYKPAVFDQKAVFNTDPFVKAAVYLKELVDMGAYPSNFNSIDNSEGMAMFMDGKAAMRYNGTWETPGNIEALGDDLGVFDWPIMPEKLSSTGYPVAQSAAWAISANSKHKYETVQFLEFLMSDERQKLLAEKGYNIAAQNIPFDASKLHPVAAKITSELAGTSNPILIWDVMLGPNIGKELNLATQAIMGGEDIQKALNSLNRMAELEWK